MLSTMDFVELEVLRITSAPPAAARLFPSWTTSSAPRSRIILSLSGECDTAMVSKPAAFAYCTAKCPTEPAVDRITSAEDRGCLLIGDFVGKKVGCVGIHQHVLGVSALRLNPCAFQIGTEHSSATLAPFAAPASGLNPSGTHTIADLSRGDVGSHGNNLTDRLVAEESG